MHALIVVDVQNDFCPGGALAVPDGDAVVEPINRLIQEIPFTVATRDWHPRDHGSFSAAGGPWPPHCVQDTAGAQLHPELESDAIDVILDKGQGREDDGYSAFERTELERLLRERDVDSVHVAGLALDYCVRATALDARGAGFRVVLHRGGVRAIGDPQATLAELRAAGVELVD